MGVVRNGAIQLSDEPMVTWNWIGFHDSENDQWVHFVIGWLVGPRGGTTKYKNRANGLRRWKAPTAIFPWEWDHNHKGKL